MVMVMVMVIWANEMGYCALPGVDGCGEWCVWRWEWICLRNARCWIAI